MLHTLARRANSRTVLCCVPNKIGVRYYEQRMDDFMDTSSQEGERVQTREQREKEEREARIKRRDADRLRLMGDTKQVQAVSATGKKKLNKEVFEKMMMPLIEKHLKDRHNAKMKNNEKILNPIPQTYTDDEQEFLNLVTPEATEQLTQQKGENDDDFWERKAIASLPRYDWLTPDLKKSEKPGRDYAQIARKMQLDTFGDPYKIPYYMRYHDQPQQLFFDEKRELIENVSSVEDVKENELAIKLPDKRDGRDIANNIQRMYNRVQKFKAQRKLEMEAMGAKEAEPPVKDSKHVGQFDISAAVILERYPTLTPPDKPYEIEHEEWQQNIRKQTCLPVIPWYIWKMEWEKIARSLKNQNLSKGILGNKKTEATQESAKKKQKGDKRVKEMDFQSTLQPPDWGLPKVPPPVFTPEEELDIQKADVKKLKPINDWIEFWRKWEAAPRETDDDLKDNRKSTNRALHKKLYLIVKRKQDNAWVFPAVKHKEEETIRMTAERSLKENVGYGLTVYFHSNAPVGFYNRYYPDAKTQEANKAESNKIFFMRSRYFRGTPDPMRRAGYSDYVWVTREQLAEYFEKEYHDRVINFIWPDPN